MVSLALVVSLAAELLLDSSWDLEPLSPEVSPDPEVLFSIPSTRLL